MEKVDDEFDGVGNLVVLEKRKFAFIRIRDKTRGAEN
jgi:hypothetical protein